MGLSIAKHCSGCDCNGKIVSVNPDPKKFEILSVTSYFGPVGNGLMARVKYPNCSTFGGDKILLFFDMTVEEFYEIKELDPHFDKDNPRLIARFSPDKATLAHTFMTYFLMGESLDTHEKQVIKNTNQ
jgi:hypothetical protein